MSSRTSKPEKKPLMVIVGGSGFIGTELAIAAVEAGMSVHIIDPDQPGEHAPEPIRDKLWNMIETSEIVWEESPIKGSFALNPETTAVVHLAKPHVCYANDDGSMDMEVITAMLDLARYTFSKVKYLSDRLVGDGCPRDIPVLVGSSASVYVPTFQNSAEGVASQMIEMLASRSGVSTTIMRIFNAFHPDYGSGVHSKMRKDAAEGEPITVHGTGNQTRDFIRVESVADVIVRLVEIIASGRGVPPALDICTGKETRIIDLGARISSETGALLRLLPKKSGGVMKSCGNPAVMMHVMESAMEDESGEDASNVVPIGLTKEQGVAKSPENSDPKTE